MLVARKIKRLFLSAIACLLIQIAHGQKLDDIILSPKFVSEVQTEIAKAKESLVNGAVKIDTSDLIYIPIIATHLSLVGSTITKLQHEPILSEVILILKKDGKPIGACHLCKDGTIIPSFTKNKYGLPVVPCRKQNQFFYLDKKCYNEVKRTHYRYDRQGMFIMVDELKCLYFYSKQMEKPKSMCH